ncbi:hypothetical protein N665_0053s0010 [Sinapis alba]|nr:hypothetical protein N665_0053s0010 [Sinapis alba]
MSMLQIHSTINYLLSLPHVLFQPLCPQAPQAHHASLQPPQDPSHYHQAQPPLHYPKSFRPHALPAPQVPSRHYPQPHHPSQHPSHHHCHPHHHPFQSQYYLLPTLLVFCQNPQACYLSSLSL